MRSAPRRSRRRRSRDTADVFRSLSDSAARTLTWHLAPSAAEGTGGTEDPKHRPGLSERAVLVLARVVRIGGGIASTTLLAPSANRRLLRTAWAPVLLAVLVVGLFVWAVLEDWLAVVLTLAGIVALVVSVTVVLRREAKHDRRARSG